MANTLSHHHSNTYYSGLVLIALAVLVLITLPITHPYEADLMAATPFRNQPYLSPIGFLALVLAGFGLALRHVGLHGPPKSGATARLHLQQPEVVACRACLEVNRKGRKHCSNCDFKL